jgi:NADH:quinone reductase (non-electrogenic)
MPEPIRPAPGARHRVAVVGGGFGGINAVERLRKLPVDITLVDRRNFHLFQPLSYQVATGALSPGEVAYPLRALFAKADNVSVLLAEVTGFDLGARRLELEPVDGGPEPDPVEYDTLIVAAGSSYSYFGHEEWRENAAEVKSLESALKVRSEILSAFERAELADDPGERAAQLTFVIVGGGPTGAEMAGQIGELARDTLPRDFRSFDSRSARVLLVEAGDRLLNAFPPSLSAKAARSLERLGVTPVLDRTVVGIDKGSVTLQAPDGSTEEIPTRTVIWAAGVSASSLAGMLGEQAGAEVDGAGRVAVDDRLTLKGHPEVLVLGDMARVHDAQGKAVDLPGVAPVAIQQGRYAAQLVADRFEGRTAAPFHYHDKGNVATLGRGAAIADLGLVRLGGVLAWFVWLVIHLWYLIGFQNRLLVLIRWSVSFVTHGRGARLINVYGDGDARDAG